MARRFFDYHFKPFFILGVVIFLSLFTEESMAAGNIHIESLKIMPSLIVTREYSDNYFPRDFKIVTDKNGQEKTVKIVTAASVIRTIPSLTLSLPFRENSFELIYRFRSVDFQDQDLNRFDTKSHFIQSKLKWHFISGFTTEIKDTLQYAENIPSYTRDIVRQYRDNTVRILTSYELGRRYISELEFEKYDLRYNQNQFKPDNLNNTTIKSRVLYQIMPKTYIGLELDHERYERKDQPGEDQDYTAQFYLVNIKFDDPDGRLKGQLSAGTEDIVYDDEALNTGGNFFAFSADLAFKKSKYTTIIFSGRRIQSNTSLNTSDAFYGSSFTNTMLSLGLQHKFTYKISGRIDFAYSDLQFSNKGATTTGGITESFNEQRKDIVKGWSGELNYQMRDWIGFRVGYSYTDDKSNISIESYKRKLFTTEISFKF
jgi:hypothetical protein